MSKATEEALATLHGEMAKAMKKKLAEGEYTASDLNVIRQFLKDNKIEADGDKNEDVKSLVDGLPEDLDDESNVTPIYGGGVS